MRILAIETSCDETAVSVIDATGSLSAPKFKVLAHAVSSQISIHTKWGGVVPNIAKREHEKNLVPMLDLALSEAGLKKNYTSPKLLDPKCVKIIKKYLIREDNLSQIIIPYLETIKIPKIDAIAVTYGPGLEPALWVGINLARALAAAWNKPIVPTNHMEGHIVSTLIETSASLKNKNVKQKAIKFPAVALLISGGHTEIIEIKNWLKYKVIGYTRDDAVGEAFDKVARLLGLPYPGGPEISKLALLAPQDLTPKSLKIKPSPASKEIDLRLPRPMLHSGDFEFSFSGIKTSVLYKVRELEKFGLLSEKVKAIIAKEFQDAVIEVLVTKTLKAIKEKGAKSLIIGGGVIANRALREAFQQAISQTNQVDLLIPDLTYTTDNASMIAAAAYLHLITKKGIFTHNKKIIASGNLSFPS
jgi:N6-L-threonylcarbamoyladenine synthase